VGAHFVVVGCGRVGSELAYRLFKKGSDVAVIDRREEAFKNLPPDFRGRTLEGEGLSLDILHRAGIQKADGLAAVTDSDSLNAVIGHVARVQFNIPHVVVRNQDPAWREFHEVFGLQIVGAASWGAQRTEELLYPAAMPIVFSAGNGEVEIYEYLVTDDWHGARIGDVLPAAECRAVALTRAGRAMLPSDDMQLETDDVLHVSATLEGIEALRARLAISGGK
jgi:trk system potassium uptake protein TrkA